MDRREFSTLLPALLAAVGGLTESSGAESLQAPAGGTSAGGVLPQLVSGVYKPTPAKTPEAPRSSRRYLMGSLKAGNLRLEIHQTTQQAGAEHEPVGTHLHNEIWLMKDGVLELTTNGVARRMEAGDVGLCVAGDTHFVRNAGDGPCTYFVVTVGPPEP